MAPFDGRLRSRLRRKAEGTHKLREMITFDMDEGFDAAVLEPHPAEGGRVCMLVVNMRTQGRISDAVSMEEDGDRLVDDEAGGDCISAKNLEMRCIV